MTMVLGWKAAGTVPQESRFPGSGPHGLSDRYCPNQCSLDDILSLKKKPQLNLIVIVTTICS